MRLAMKKPRGKRPNVGQDQVEVDGDTRTVRIKATTANMLYAVAKIRDTEVRQLIGDTLDALALKLYAESYDALVAAYVEMNRGRPENGLPVIEMPAPDPRKGRTK